MNYKLVKVLKIVAVGLVTLGIASVTMNKGSAKHRHYHYRYRRHVKIHKAVKRYGTWKKYRRHDKLHFYWYR